MKPLADGGRGAGRAVGLARRRDRRARRATACPTSTRCRTPSTARAPTSIVYFLFDVPYFDGHDLRARAAARAPRAAAALLEAQRQRARALQRRLRRPTRRSMLRSACALKLEGIIAKRADAPYVSRAHRRPGSSSSASSGRSSSSAASPTARARAPRSAACCSAYYDDDGKLRYAGNVGTGWNSATAADLHKRLVEARGRRRRRSRPASVKPGRWSQRAAGSERWVKPQLVAEVELRRLDARRPASATRRSRACAPTSRRSDDHARSGAAARADAPRAPTRQAGVGA